MLLTVNSEAFSRDLDTIVNNHCKHGKHATDYPDCGLN